MGGKGRHFSNGTEISQRHWRPASSLPPFPTVSEYEKGPEMVVVVVVVVVVVAVGCWLLVVDCSLFVVCCCGGNDRND